MPLTIPISVQLFNAGASGVPSQTTPLINLAQRLDSYQHSIAATFGFENMTTRYEATLAEALVALNSYLMAGVWVYGPDAETCWEGAIVRVDVTIGGDSQARSLEDGFANRVRSKYTDVLGSPQVTSSTSDSTSQNLYGIKDYIVSLSTTDSTSATNEATIELAARKNPVNIPATAIKTGGNNANISVTLTAMGWYGFLDWLVTSNTTTSSAATDTQVGTLISNYNAVNAFLSSTTNIASTGISMTQKIDGETTYRKAIEDRLSKGDGTNRWAWGCYESRVFTAQAWAGANPTTVDYVRYFNDARVYNAGGGVIAPWNVRPDTMLQKPELLDPLSLSAPDSMAYSYVERVVCDISGSAIGVQLEPARFDSAAARIAKLTRGGA
jgi:hypothetical protein